MKTITPPPPSITPKQKTRISAIYFFTFLAFSSVMPYLSLYYDSIPFTGSQIGFLLGIGSLLGLFATPFWTSLADATGKHAWVLIGGAAAICLLYALIPAFSAFAPVLIIILLVGLLSPQILPLEDSATMHMLGPQQALYGRLRLWGTVSWGIGAMVFGPLYGAVGLRWMFWCFGLVMLVNVLLLPALSFDQASRPEQRSSGLITFLKEPRWLLFLAVTLLCGMGIASWQSFMPLVVDSFDPAHLTVFGFVLSPPSLIGFTLVVGTLAELPVMFYAEKLVQTLKVRNMVLLSLAVITFRIFLFALNVSAIHTLVVQVLHGLTFATLWLAGVNFVGRYAPTGLKATGQGLFTTVFLGLGYSIGNILSGALVDLVGLSGMFAIMGGILAIGLLSAWLIDSRTHLLRLSN